MLHETHVGKIKTFLFKTKCKITFLLCLTVGLVKLPVTCLALFGAVACGLAAIAQGYCLCIASLSTQLA
jgi:hypothetical protein